MKLAIRAITIGILVLGISLSAAPAAEFNMKVTTEDISLGKHVAGPELTKDDLKHRVVFVEFWGIH